MQEHEKGVTMEKLTDISLITGLAMPIKLMESCGEDSCSDACELHSDNNCIGCPVQECMTKLHSYQKTDLEPEEIEQLKKDKTFWELEAKRQAAELGEMKIKIAIAVNKIESIHD